MGRVVEPASPRFWTSLVVVVGWRIAAAVSPYREGVLGSMTADPLPVRWALGAMGLLFVVTAAWARRRAAGPASRWLTAYLLAAGLHWGGPIALPVDTLETVLMLGYLVASDFLAQGLLLGFALRVTSSRWATPWRAWLLFLPALVGALLGVTIVSSREGSALRSALVELLPLLFLVSTLYGATAVVALAVRGTRVRQDRHRFLVAAAALLVPSVVSLLAPSLPGPSDVYNLGFVVVPVALGWLAAAESTSSTPTGLDRGKR